MSSFYGNVGVSSGSTSGGGDANELIFCDYDDLPAVGQKDKLYITEQGIFFYDGKYTSPPSSTSANPQWGEF